MKRLLLAVTLASATLTGCAPLKEAFSPARADAGATAAENPRPYPKSSSDLQLH